MLSKAAFVQSGLKFQQQSWFVLVRSELVELVQLLVLTWNIWVDHYCCLCENHDLWTHLIWLHTFHLKFFSEYLKTIKGILIILQDLAIQIST